MSTNSPDDARVGVYVAGVVLAADPTELPHILAHLSTTPGLTIHSQDACRAVITLETESADAQEVLFEWVRRLRGVHTLNLVSYHAES